VSLWRFARGIPGWILPLALGIVILLLPFAGLGFSTSRQIQLTLILALVVSGLNLSLGYAGELALGQAAMYASGAYIAGMLSKVGHTDLLLQLLLAGAGALAVGVITGIPGLRLGSWSLAMTSFFLVLLLPDVLAIFPDETGGRNGLSGIQSPTLLGTVLDGTGYYVVVAAVAILWFALLRNIVVSRHGIAFRVLKQIPAGLAGVLFANLDLYVSPEAFSFTLATTVLAASILGGSASVYGALVGAAVMQFGPSQSSDFQQYALVFTGLFLVLGGALLTGGLSGVGRTLVDRLDRAVRLNDADPTAGTAVPEVPEIRGATLRIRNVSKAFGGNQALKDVSFEAPRGKVTALIGPNGSGKTTLLNMVCGFYRTDAGQITLDDTQLQGLAPEGVARAGVARTFQTPNIPEGVTVSEAVASGRYTGHRASILSAVLRTPRFRRVRRDDLQEAERVLALVGMEHLADAEATSLPLGMRRLLEVARGLIGAPGVLLLDEAASGLDESEVDRLARLIRRIRDAGGTVVLVEHNFQLVLSLADDIVVLAHGQLIASGPPEAIENNPRVLSEYLGVDPDSQALHGTVGQTTGTGAPGENS
jgi:branched-chain amino acid transport system permease protein